MLPLSCARKCADDRTSASFRILARWCADKAKADKKGTMIVVTTDNNGAVTGGPAFIQQQCKQ